MHLAQVGWNVLLGLYRFGMGWGKIGFGAFMDLARAKMLCGLWGLYGVDKLGSLDVTINLRYRGWKSESACAQLLDSLEDGRFSKFD